MPPDQLDFPETLNLLAKVYEKQGRSEEAETFYVEAYDFYLISLCRYPPKTAFTFNKFAKIYHLPKRYQEAEGLFQKSVEILKEVEILPAAGWCLRNLGVLYTEKKELIRAQAFLHEAIDILQKCLPPEHPYVLKCKDDLNNLQIAAGLNS